MTTRPTDGRGIKKKEENPLARLNSFLLLLIPLFYQCAIYIPHQECFVFLFSFIIFVHMLVSLAYYFLPWRSSAEYDFQKTIQALTGHVFPLHHRIILLFSLMSSSTCSLIVIIPPEYFFSLFQCYHKQDIHGVFFPSYSLSTLPFYPLHGLIMSAPDIDYTSFSALLSPFFLLFCSVLFSFFFPRFSSCLFVLCHAHTKKRRMVISVVIVTN